MVGPRRLDPSVAEALRQDLGGLAQGRGPLLLFTPRTAPAGLDLTASLELHDARDAPTLSGPLRRITEWEVGRVYKGRGLRSGEEVGRLIRAAMAVSPALAFPLTTVPSGFIREAAVSAITGIP